MEISGTKIAGELTEELKSASVDDAKLKIILVGNDPASLRYVRKKEALARELGVDFELKTFDIETTQEEIINQISNWQKEPGRVGIIVQLPLPRQLDKSKIISKISNDNDVDGLRYCAGLESNFVPPVVRAIDRVLDETEIELDKTYTKNNIVRACREPLLLDSRTHSKNKSSNLALNHKNIVIIGRGFLVGGPLERYLTEKYPTANIKSLGKNDSDWLEAIKTGDVLIGAAPAPRIITGEMIKDGVVIIDAGSAEEDNAIHGNFASDCYPKASFYTPVPGGIGPLTVAMIFKNLVSR